MPESDLRLFFAALPQQFQNFRIKTFQSVPAPAALVAGSAAFPPFTSQPTGEFKVFRILRAQLSSQFVAQFAGQGRTLSAGGYGDRQAAPLQPRRQGKIAKLRGIGDIHQRAGCSGLTRRLFIDRRAIRRAPTST